MVNASKILTVSYGTFSCTLEGFDEPFSTMRSIAEYFRDLAADDRYFGAEPPTPDAEMLHRIAEREIKRRVEAKVEDNSVVLRQVEDHANPATDRPVKVTIGAVTPANSTPAAEFTDTVDEETVDPEQDAVADSVAAKLARIRAAVARSRTETEPLLNSVFAEDEHAEPLYEDAPIEAAFEQHDAELNEPDEIDELDITKLLDGGPLSQNDSTDDAEGPEGESAETVEDTDVAAALIEEATEVEIEEGAALRTEAVQDAVLDEAEADESVSEAETEDFVAALDDANDDSGEDLLDDGEAVSLDEVLTQTAQEQATEAPEAEETIEDMLDVEKAAANGATEGATEGAEDAAETTEAEEDIDLAAMLDAAVAEASDVTPEEDTADNDAPLDLSAIMGTELDDRDTAEAAVADASDDAPLDLGSVNLLSDDADLAAMLVDDDGDETEAEADDADLSKLILTGEDRSDAEQAEEETEELAVPRVRVMKMSRDDFEAQFTEVEETAEEADISDAEGIREAIGDTGLSAEDEEDLINELVELERDAAAEIDTETDPETDDAEMVAGFDDATAVQTAEPEPENVSAALAALVAETAETSDNAAQPEAAVGKADDASVDRLLARADTALEDGEGSRRRSAIAHLKAAVAAVRADGNQVKKNADAETARAMGQYREDLARAVRPDNTPSTPPVVEDEMPTEPVENAAAETPQRAEPTRVRPRRKMPPLMLVSEQRIDKTPDTGASTPVHPRRVQSYDLDAEIENELFVDEAEKGEAAVAGNIFTETSDFKGFVAETGAEGTQELLEASLAFGLFVEGAQFNSRPQVMKRMLTLFPDGSVTREDGLRAFGVLLREGRIIRVKRGQFLLPEASRFYQGNAPEANMAG